MTQFDASVAPKAPRAHRPQSYQCITDLYEQRLRAGELLAARCSACGEVHFPPTPRCDSCQSRAQTPFLLSGRARLASADVAEGPGEWSLGLVLFEEGLSVRAPLVGAFADPEFVRKRLSEKPVEVRPSVIRGSGLAILAFEPTEMVGAH